MTNFCEIELTKIYPNPKNPRRRYDARKLDELTASVLAKGVIEPIIVRPLKKGKTPYEIVAGERRFRASAAAGLATIPAIVRELTDDEAYDFMLVENLQRDDLTDREEAESFKAYAGRHGEDAIVELAEKTGISPAYIRARVRILELPARVLKAWEEGRLCFGHLQQLLRVAGDPKTLKKITDDLMSSIWENGAYTVARVRGWINDLAPVLSGAFFPMKEACAGCGSSSIVQKDLFDVDADKALCLNPACFKKRQNDYLAGHWKETSLARAHGTNGFRFSERMGSDLHDFHYGPKPSDKCRSCPNFVTVIELDGKVEEPQSCAGAESCFAAVTNPRSGKGKATERDPEAPRAKWHGEFYRDVFLSKRIPEVLATVDPEDPKIKMLLFVCAVHGNRFTIDMRTNSANLLAKPTPEIRKAFKTLVEKVVLSGQHVGDSEYNGFGTKARRLVAEYLGIDLAKEYVVDKDYLDKKTKAEIMAFGKKFKLLKDDAGKLKKTELVKAILAHGPKLVGKVPAEILK